MKQTFKKPSYYLLSQAMDGDEKLTGIHPEDGKQIQHPGRERHPPADEAPWRLCPQGHYGHGTHHCRKLRHERSVRTGYQGVPESRNGKGDYAYAEAQLRDYAD